MSYLWLNSTVEAVCRGRDLILWSGKQYVKVDGFGNAGVEFLKKLDGSHEESALRATPGSFLILKLLKRFQWLVKLARPLSETVADKPWLSRQLAYLAQINSDEPDRALQELQQKTVLIVGVGGVGSHVAFSLAGSGVGKLSLVDPDVVEPSNLNRQILFSSKHFGINKARAIVTELEHRFPGVALKAIPHPFTMRHFSKRESPNVIMLCGGATVPFDHPEKFRDTAVLVAGYAGRIGLIGPFARPAGGLSWPDLLELTWPTSQRSLPARGVSRRNAWNTSGATINGLIGAIAGELIIRHLAPSLGPCPLAPDERMLVDMRTLRFRRERLKRLPGNTK